MKRSLLSKVLFVAAASIGSLFVSGNASAVPINITNNGVTLVTDAPFLGDNNPSTHFDWLAGQGAFAGQGIVSGYNTITPATLPAPVFLGMLDASANRTGEIDVSAFTYATVHYGKGGKSGTEGGGVVAYYLNGQAKFTFPQDGAGPNGLGGISSVYLFGPKVGVIGAVPDTGATGPLFALIGIGILVALRIRRK